MQFSSFGEQFTGPCGTVQLMDDLGSAMAGDAPVCMLGGGNPGRVPQIEARCAELLARLATDDNAIHRLFGSYAGPAGEQRFIAALAELLASEYGWAISERNIALTNGSQNAFFYLFNLFGGRWPDGSEKKVLLPLAPEYIGYGDVFVAGRHFIANRPSIEMRGDGLFKYHVDFETLEVGDDIGAICVSRPTNPTGNVLSDAELAQLDRIAQSRGIPLIVDNAYGLPFPGLIFTGGTPLWHDNIVMCLSLSKFGLPGLRTGIVIAREEIIDAISRLNAIVNLAPGSAGAALTAPLVESGEIISLGREVIRPFYQRKAEQALGWLREALGDYPVHVHVPEGALFLWLWFEGLPISSAELYRRLKARRVIIVPGEHFFPGLEGDDWRHKRECIRLTYSQDETSVREGIRIIAAEAIAAYDEATG